jgi:hypothetical protein
VKFHRLRPGARFEYKGVAFRKISPLKAASEADDSHKLIPRSAEVDLLDERGRRVAEKLPEKLASERVKSELEKFFAACDLAATCLDPPLTHSQLTQLRFAVSGAGQDLLARLILDR